MRGLSALQIGETLFVTGLCQFLAAPIVGRLLTKMDPRLMIGLGFLGFACGAALPAFITKDWDFGELLIPQILRGFSLIFMMVPINNLALGTLPPDAAEKRLGPVQRHPQPRRRGGAGGDQHHASTSALTCIWRGCTKNLAGAMGSAEEFLAEIRRALRQ